MRTYNIIKYIYVIKRNLVVGVSGDIDLILLSYYPYGPDDPAVLVRIYPRKVLLRWLSG
jgi:hypothetical protein